MNHFPSHCHSIDNLNDKSTHSINPNATTTFFYLLFTYFIICDISFFLNCKLNRNQLTIHSMKNRTVSVMERIMISEQQPNLQPHLMMHKLVVLVLLMMVLQRISRHRQKRTIHSVDRQIHLVIKRVEMLVHMM